MSRLTAAALSEYTTMKVCRFYADVPRPWVTVVDSPKTKFAQVTNSDLIALFGESFKVTSDGERVLVECGDFALHLGIVGDEVEPFPMRLFQDLTEEKVLEKNLGFKLELSTEDVSPEGLTRVEAAFDAAEQLVNDHAARLTHPTESRTLREALGGPTPKAIRELKDLWWEAEDFSAGPTRDIATTKRITTRPSRPRDADEPVPPDPAAEAVEVEQLLPEQLPDQTGDAGGVEHRRAEDQAHPRPPSTEYGFTVSDSGTLFDHSHAGVTNGPLRAVRSETVVVELPRLVDAWRAERRLDALNEDGVKVLRHGRNIEVEGTAVTSALSLLATFVRESDRPSGGRLYAYLSFLLAILTLGTWLVPCTGTSVLISIAVFLALVVVVAGVVRRVAAAPFYRSVGGLTFSFTGFFVLFAFLYALAWLHDAQTLENVELTARLGEMFLVSLGVAVSGGTIAATVHEEARIIAYVEMLLVFGGGAAFIAAVVGRYLLTERAEKGEPVPPEDDQPDRPPCPTCGRP